jgi:hypothetical protein
MGGKLESKGLTLLAPNMVLRNTDKIINSTLHKTH